MRRRRRPTALVVRVLVIALIVHFFVIPQLGGARREWHLLSGVQVPLLALGIVAEAVSLVAYAQLVRSVLPPPTTITLGRSLRIILCGLALGHVLPGGSAASSVMNFRLLREAGVDGAAVTYTLGTVGIGSAAVLNVILVAALTVSIPVSGFDPIYAAAAALGVVILALLSFGIVALTRGRDTTVRVGRVLAGRLPFVEPDQVEDGLHRIADSLAGLTRDRRRARRAIFWAALNWLADAASLAVFVAAFGPAPRLDGLMVAYGLANVLAALPITPGGLGVVEGVLIPSLVGFGTPRAAASLGVVAFRLINFWLPIPIGALTYLSLRLDRSALLDDADTGGTEPARDVDHAGG